MTLTFTGAGNCNSTIRDPVTGFSYPQEWIAACKSPSDLGLAESGLGVLLSSGAVLRRGYTTGTTAAAACKAAILSTGRRVSEVSVMTPCGIRVAVKADGEAGVAACRKYSGDYLSDVTCGIEIIARLNHQASPDAGCDQGSGSMGVTKECRLIVGEGIGRFTRDMPRFPAGAPSISRTAMDSILNAMREASEEVGNYPEVVTLTIPRGVEVARLTLNPKLGIVGGISILGSTGLVEPWDDHLAASALDRIRSHKRVVLTTGRIGLRYSRLMFPDFEQILVGINMKDALNTAAEAGSEVILCGLPGLILKFIDPHVLDGTGFGTVEEMSASVGFENVLSEKIREFRAKYPGMRLVVIDRTGGVLGDSNDETLGRDLP